MGQVIVEHIMNIDEEEAHELAHLAFAHHAQPKPRLCQCHPVVAAMPREAWRWQFLEGCQQLRKAHQACPQGTPPRLLLT